MSDSQYTLGIANGSYTPSKNLELAIELRTLYTGISITTRWVAGHNGDTWNEKCDSLAKEAKLAITPEKAKRRMEKKKAKKNKTV